MTDRADTRRFLKGVGRDVSKGRTSPRAGPSEDPGLVTVRRLLLALVLVGSLGLGIELLLLEHYDSPWQWTPLGLLSAALITGAMVWLRPNRRTILVFRGLMMAFVAASLLGMALHYRSNAAFEREMDSTISGGALVWYAIRGATPALAPGALLQLGILGLILAYRHPALRRPGRVGGPEP